MELGEGLLTQDKLAAINVLGGFTVWGYMSIDYVLTEDRR